ncbi:MAG TPA: exodeoxyribonuclease VII large subunit [Candidatus Acidoferrales bacterium]|jgi:exodeoxyribonuclease VII large subunit|nr:exodeoxyribonuclease VII large subunit [Candidatus Acidoferrales bacterium]
MNETPAPRVVRTVREFTSGLQKWFAGHRQLQDVAISGEISGLHPFSGHLGFTLKDEQSVLECVVWSDKRRLLPELKNGTSAIAIGSVRIRPDRSGYQLIVDSVELTGLGELFLLFERLKEKFRSEGLFEIARKRAVPELPRRVALISARGKAMEDFVETIQRSVPFVEVEFIETKVQGMAADVEISAAIDDASRRNVDAIVLTRGGGSYEDLFPFNLEAVVRAIVRAKHPVLTAIGHSGDHHLADDVADMTFGTPSLVAEHIARGWILAQRRLQTGKRDLLRATRDVFGRAAQRIDASKRELDRVGVRTIAVKRAALAERTQRLDRQNPQRVVAERRERLAATSGKIDTAFARLMSRKAHMWGESSAALKRCAPAYLAGVLRRLERAEDALNGLDPLRPLSLGYAIVLHDGKAVKDVSAIKAGDELEARFERGMARARVESVRQDG